jgi:hypothetical protein
MKLTRGDLSPCGTMRFWQYQTYVKRDGTRAECWVSTHMYESKKEQAKQIKVLSEAKRDWNDMLRQRRAA